MKTFWPTLYGHNIEFGFLKNAVTKGNVAHAQIFHGPESVGKRICALHFAKLLFETHNPQIDHQALLQVGNHPDFYFLQKPDDKKDISVEQVRSLLCSLKLKPYYQGAIVAIIDNAHYLNKSASNALLKTLEEPNDNTYLLLISDKPHLLLETISSRCQAISFGQLAQESCQSLLLDICQAIDCKETLAQQLLTVTEGSLQSLALSSLVARHSNAINNEKELTEHLTNSAANIAAVKKKIEKVINEFAAQSFDQMIASLAEVDLQNVDRSLFWQILRNLLRARMRLSSRQELKTWSRLLQNTTQAEYNIERRNSNPQLQLCSIFLENNI